MKFRKLRIAFSAICGIACVLLIVLWVRSYRVNSYGDWISAGDFFTNSKNGRIFIFESDDFNVATAGRTQVAGYAHDIPIMIIAERPELGTGLYINAMLPVTLWVFVAPHWLCIAVAATLSSLPWLPWSKRFSLRTLLIATTLVAAVLGLVVWAATK
jgi:hypothetical protein